MGIDPSPDPCVWVCTTLNDIHKIISIKRKEYGSWRLQQTPELAEWTDRMLQESARGWKRGEVLTQEHVGDMWYFEPHPDYVLPPFVSAGGFPLVSESVKTVLEQFDIGETIFHPLKIMDWDETRFTTPEPYYFLNVCNKRSIGNYEALSTKGDVTPPLRNRHGIVFLPNSDHEEKLVVVPEALDGPDIWLDPKVSELLFLSDQLVAGLKQAGMDKGWGLVRASVGRL